MPKAVVNNRRRDQHRSLSDPDPLMVRPITTALGVNPDWQESQDTALEVPAYNGVQQITQMALMFTLWSRVEDFLYSECQISPLPVEKEEIKQLGILRESETSVICLLCLLNNEPYTAGRLVDAMISQNSSADQRGNARKRLLSRTLPVIADRYGLLQYREHNKGNLKEYRISRSARLAAFAEQHLVTGVQQIIGGEFSQSPEPEAVTIQHELNTPGEHIASGEQL